jgi:branched-chain amino acid aminotransferase
MSEYLVYLNGRLIPESEAHLSIWDRGFTLGDAVFDTTRTFRHQPFRLNDHLTRLYRSLRYVHIDIGLAQVELRRAAEEVLAANVHLVAEDDDVMLTFRVSRGTPKAGATVLITCRPVDFSRFAHLYQNGVELVTPTVRAVSRDTMDPRVKSQSRIVNALAEIQAAEARPGAWPLLCTSRGVITESARASFLIVQDGVILASKEGRVLTGVTAAVNIGLAEGLGCRVEERDLTPYDVLLADEAFITSTSICVLSVASLNGVPINGGAVPGPITTQLIEAWQELTGVDTIAQARKHVHRAAHREAACTN